MPLLLLPLVTMLITQNPRYAAEKTVVDTLEVVRLTDASSQTEVLIAPSLGNNACEMRVKGKRVLWSPYQSLREVKARPTLMGNPFLAPWANRLDHDGYYANGKEFLLNPKLGNFDRDGGGHPIHGLLTRASEWRVVALKADDGGAEVTSRLEFWRDPERMAQFPFAHTIDMTYRLRDGALEVETVLENHSTQPMPVSIGYHPYFQVNDAPRDEWTIRLGAREHWTLSKELLPTGERKPPPYPDPLPLKGVQLDDVFSGLGRDSQGRAEVWLQGKQERVTVVYGPKYPVAVVYAPKGGGFVCFEPMTAPTNGMNLHHAGLYKDLQTVPPGGRWKESFWIRPSGF